MVYEFIFNSNQVVNVLYPDPWGMMAWYKFVPLPIPCHFGPIEGRGGPEWYMHVYDVANQVRKKVALVAIQDWVPAEIVTDVSEQKSEEYREKMPAYQRM
mgnify:CR=1 FL=1